MALNRLDWASINEIEEEIRRIVERSRKKRGIPEVCFATESRDYHMVIELKKKIRKIRKGRPNADE